MSKASSQELANEHGWCEQPNGTWSDISAVLIADGAEPSVYASAAEVCAKEHLHPFTLSGAWNRQSRRIDKTGGGE